MYHSRRRPRDGQSVGRGDMIGILVVLAAVIALVIFMVTQGGAALGPVPWSI